MLKSKNLKPVVHMSDPARCVSRMHFRVSQKNLNFGMSLLPLVLKYVTDPPQDNFQHYRPMDDISPPISKFTLYFGLK